MPKLLIKRSILISAPVETVCSLVRDYSRWPEWSPWLRLEKEAGLKFAEDGCSYEWKGDIIGSGRIELIKETANTSLTMKLNIFEPWKSESVIYFAFKPVSGKTQVTWRMDGTLPFFLFFMRRTMEGIIAMDYQRGLGMLKDKAELGIVHSDLEFSPDRAYPRCSFVAINRSCAISEMPEQMKSDYMALKHLFDDQAIQSVAAPFTRYSKWDIAKGLVEYSACFPVAECPSDLASPFVYSEQPSVNAYVIRHQGAYRHIGNAWSAGMIRERANLFQSSKNVPPFEVYLCPMDSMPDEEIITEVFFPIEH